MELPKGYAVWTFDKNSHLKHQDVTASIAFNPYDSKVNFKVNWIWFETDLLC